MASTLSKTPTGSKSTLIASNSQHLSGPDLLFGYSAAATLPITWQVLEGRGRVVSAVVMVDASRRLAPAPDRTRRWSMRLSATFCSTRASVPCSPPRCSAKSLGGASVPAMTIVQLVDRHTIQAPIHLLLCEDDPADYHDAQGRLLASTAAWERQRKAALPPIKALEHINMLIPPYLGAECSVSKSVI